MRSIKTLIFRHFFVQALLPIFVIEFSLILTLFLLNNYQSQQNKDALQGIANEAFLEIATQTSERINQHFTHTKNALEQLTNTSEIFLSMRDQRPLRSENYQHIDNYFQYAPPHVSKNGFYRFMQPKNTTVYTTNLKELSPYDYSILNSLVPLTPISKAIVETPHSLITNIWINIDKKYAFSYPPINPKDELSPTLDVTKFKFYYSADPAHDPDKEIRFIPLYKEAWALKNGELGTYVKPLYLDKYFLGVAGFTLNVKEIARVINALDLPFEARAMLLDKDNTLIASSDPKAIKKDFGAHSFYQMHAEAMPHNDSTMMIDIQRLQASHFISNTMLINGTDLKLVIYVDKATIFAPIDVVSQQSVKVGLYFIIGIALFYLFFFWFNFVSLKRLSTAITKPLNAIVTFSSQLGRKEKFHLEASKIKELETLNTNLNSTHHELLDMLIKDKESGLFNRHKLLIDLPESTAVSLLVLKVQNYHTILNYYGQESAFALLTCIITALKKETDLRLYRITDSTIAVLVPKQHGAYFTTLIERLNSIQLTHNSVELHPFVYAGVVEVSQDVTDLDKATLALNNALANKTSTPTFYKEEFDNSRQIHDNLMWAGRLKEAITQERIKPYFQPIYNLKTNKIEKFEALVRIEEEGKALSPQQFLESAEKMGRIHEITLMMIRKVYEVAAKFPQLTFSINLSFKDIQDARILDFIINQTIHHGIKPQQIVFELLETEAIEDSEKSIAFFSELKRTGFGIAIDDFGTGHSNFANLSMMQVDFIKIDGQFVKDIVTNPSSYAISKSINEFAKVMGAQSIAEFVKDQETLAVVKALGVDYAQGFVISKAVAEHEIDALLHKFND